MTSALVRPGETPEAALARLERRADFARVIESDAGQALLAAIRRRQRTLYRREEPA